MPQSLKDLFPPTPSVWPKDLGITNPHHYHGLENFGVIIPGIAYRCRQPTRDGFQLLAEAVGAGRVLKVVNLRIEADDMDPPWQIDTIRPTLSYYRVPIVDETAPTEKQVDGFFGFVNQRANWPFIVHCHGGEGRAGLFSALIRYSWCGWMLRKINAETANFRRIRWQYHADWLPVLNRYLRLAKPQRDFLRAWMDSHAPAALRPVL